MKHPYIFQRLTNLCFWINLKHHSRTACTLAAILLLATHNLLAQDVLISGTIKEPNGDPLPGVSIAIKGTTRGTQSDSQGAFSLNAPPNAVLVFSFIGKNTQEVSVGSQSVFNIVLEDDLKTLSEVIVVGYGTQKKQDLTGSVATVSSKDFVQGQITNPEQLVAGKIAGVQITNGGGQPGTGSTIRIRGGSSLNANNDPLYVIDGVPIDNSGVSGASNPLSFINPNDIETFTVLKDASATAIYGSRASNGVIIITTKKGKQGDALHVNFSTVTSVSNKIKNVDVLSADDFRTIVNAKGTAAQKALLGGASTNWQNEIYQTALSSDNNISLTGALKKMPFRASIGYLNQNGILKTSNLERTSASLGLSPRFLQDHLRVDINLKGTVLKNIFAEQGAIGAAVAFDPTQSVSSGSDKFGGNFEWIDPSTKLPNTLATRNPLGLLNQNRNESNVQRAIGNIVLDYRFHFLPELRANLNLGFDLSASKGWRYVPADAASNFNNGGLNTDYAQLKTNKTFEFYLNYTKDLSAISSRIDVTGGYAYQDFLRDESNANYIKKENETAPFKTQNTLVSFFSRLNYTFLNRYILTATIRRDGSSRFAPENRWGTFPSAALAWKIKDEAFLKDSRLLSDLKLRLGYGVTGQQDVGSDYPYLPRYTLGDGAALYQLGDKYYYPYRPEGYDANIKWESTTTQNIGIDYGILDGRISGSVDYYFKKTKDLLSTIPIPAASNLTNQLLTNVGNIENKGVEITINTNPIRKKDFDLSFNFNVTFNQNTITNLTKVPSETFQGILIGGISGGVGNTAQIHSVGYPTYSFYLQKQVYDETGKPLEGVYADLNGDGKSTLDDRYRYKSPASQAFLGFSSQVRYKKWNGGFTMRSNIGNYVYNNVSSNNGAYNNFTGSNGFLSNVNASVNKTQFSNNQYFSDYYVENASFVRMDNINLGYNFGAVKNSKITARVSANVQNVFVITKYTGLDPEVSGGIDNNLYPRPRVFALSLNLGY